MILPKFAKPVYVVIDWRLREFPVFASTHLLSNSLIHFFGFSIISGKNRMIQAASCGQALLKTNRKRTHWNLSFTDISSTWSAIRECIVGFRCFFVREFNAFEIFMQK